MEEESWKEVIEGAWESATGDSNVPVSESLKKVVGELQSWYTNVLGDWEKSLKKIKKELEACRRGLLSEEVVRREVVLWGRKERLEAHINMFRKQQSHHGNSRKTPMLNGLKRVTVIALSFMLFVQREKGGISLES